MAAYTFRIEHDWLAKQEFVWVLYRGNLGPGQDGEPVAWSPNYETAPGAFLSASHFSKLLEQGGCTCQLQPYQERPIEAPKTNGRKGKPRKRKKTRPETP